MSFFPDDLKLNNTFTANVTSKIQSTNGTIHNQKNYFSRTPPVYDEKSMHFFEKSSNYFDGDLVPLRVHSLLPHTKLVIILVDPIRRAYSWYQHMKAHNHPAALEFSFYDVVSQNRNNINVNQTMIKKLRDLRNRCLFPGHYAIHLERWLSYFPSTQVL